jgi:guanylate kinase
VRQLVPNLDFSISYTTRPPRGNEQNGKEYFFVTREEFEEMARRDEFLEYADVFGNWYGTSRRFLREAQQADHDLLLDIDVQGAEKIKQKLPQAVSVFVLPPNRQELELRLRHRSLDSDAVIETRLITATREIENYTKYDYILVNDRLEDSVEALRSILLAERVQRSKIELTPSQSAMLARAETCRLENLRPRLLPILATFIPAGTRHGPSR